MNGPKRANESGCCATHAPKNTVSKMKLQSGAAQGVKNAVAMRPKNVGVSRVKNAVSGPPSRGSEY